VVAHHTHRTLAAVDIHPARTTEVPPSSWAESLGSPTAVRLGQGPVVMEVHIEGSQDRAQEEAVDNTGVPEAAEALY